MNNEQIIEYVKEMIVDNLSKRGFFEEVCLIKVDKTNKTLIYHINGLIELFTKAKEILENKGDKK